MSTEIQTHKETTTKAIVDWLDRLSEIPGLEGIKKWQVMYREYDYDPQHYADLEPLSKLYTKDNAIEWTIADTESGRRLIDFGISKATAFNIPPDTLKARVLWEFQKGLFTPPPAMNENPRELS